MSNAPVTDAPVLVTGAAGFVAAHIVRELLGRGYRVRGTVRSLQKQQQLLPLRALPGADERLELVEAELLEAEGLERAAVSCTHVIHTASPYALDVKDPQRDLVDPAVKGTHNVLAACAKAGSVKRVVVTSSMAAITDEPGSDRKLTEADWNERSSLARNAYYYSKTLAEREAWRFAEEEQPGFDVVVINPFMVVGPSIGPGLNTSNQVLVDLVKGAFPGIVSITWGFVDVRDVALAHVLAAESPAASGRYICANTNMSMRELVGLMAKEGYGKGFKLPKLGLDSAAGDLVVRLSSYLQPKGVGSYLRTHVGRTPSFDNGKVQRDVGLRFRPLEETLHDTIEDLKRWGHLPAPAVSV